MDLNEMNYITDISIFNISIRILNPLFSQKQYKYCRKIGGVQSKDALVL